MIKEDSNQKYFQMMVLLCVVLLGTTLLIFNYPFFEDEQSINSGITDTLFSEEFTSESISDEEIKDRLLKHIYFDEREDPTIGNIDAVELLQELDFEFYKNAQNGDKLIFIDEKAIVYRVETDQIINVTLIDNSNLE